MRKLLLISYHFPPDAAVGAIRPAKFAKYLSRLGWKPYVLTVDERYAAEQDHTRSNEVAQLPTTRTDVWPTVLQLAVQARRTIRKERSTPAAPAAAGRNADSRISDRIKRLLNSVFELPDKQIGWLIPAVRAAHRLVRKEGIELVITSSPPRTTALIGLALSYLDRIRLVTDLRDPWFVPNFQDPAFMTLSDFASSRSAAGDAIERWLEGKLLERSARVITTTEHHARALREAYPRLPIDRVCTIPNGYDAEDFAQIDDAQPAAKFTLSYLGTFYLRRTPKPLFEALSQLIREGTVSPADLELNLIGDVRSTMDGSVDNLIASYGLADCVRLRGAVSYRESLEWMVQSNLLLLFAPNQRCSIPGKTFEYMAAHRPILCLAQDGATADLINDTATGVVIPPDDVGAIKAAVAKFVDAFRTGRPGTNGADISRYDRKTQSEQFSRLLAEIA